MPDDRHGLTTTRLDWATGPETPVARPEPGVIDLWRIALDQPAAAVSKARETLSGEELARAHRYRLDRRRARFIVGRSSMRRILAAYCGTTARALRFDVAPAGRPSLAGAADVAFSYSKTNAWAVLAVTQGGALGVDIEEVAAKPDLDLVVGDQYSPAERAQLAGLPDALRLEAFYRGWTAKEALVKATGEGLTSLLPRMTVDLDPGAPARLIEGPAPYEPASWRLAAFALDGAVLGAAALDRPILAIKALIG